jgi:hypothetical protein
LAVKQNHAGRQSKQRIIAAAPDVATRVKVRTALPNNDATGRDALAAVDFYAQALAV